MSTTGINYVLNKSIAVFGGGAEACNEQINVTLAVMAGLFLVIQVVPHKS